MTFAVELPGFAAARAKPVNSSLAGARRLPPPRLLLRASRVSGPPLVPRPAAGGGAGAGPRAAGFAASLLVGAATLFRFLHVFGERLGSRLARAHHIGGQFQIGLLRRRLGRLGGLSGALADDGGI